MRETLLFASSQEMSAVLEKIQAAFPTVRLLSEAQDGSDGFPVGIDLGAVDERMWCQWSLENDIFQHCNTLVLLSLDPPEWMKLVIEAVRLKKDAEKLSGS